MVGYSPEDMMCVTADYLKRNPRRCRPHAVILGAGASIQAFPDGDRNGLRLPDMNCLAEATGVDEVLRRHGILEIESNFEQVYARLYREAKYNDCIGEVEKKIYDYFSQMKLPNDPTLYDHLLLPLRDQDLVATFNWTRSCLMYGSA